MSIVNIQNLHKSYYTQEKGIQILSDLNMQVGESEIVSVEGASGVGKSTLLNILGAMDSYDEGKVEVCSEDLSRLSEKQKEKFRAEKIAFIFQRHLLLPDFTALENVMIPLLINKVSRSKAKQEAAEMLGRVGLGDRMESFPSQLSGGESARVGVARALVGRKQLVLADEPTGNLDKETSKNLMNLILSLQKEFSFSMVIVTHDMEVAGMAGRRNKIINGKLFPIES
ncbi:MAG: ABC transporter ATP-binding protein [Leptospiraceae bacterium]|nr:ABC transporter ATP-binding protein [Leptospiraceae bacterium]MCP5501852.1 ABC transporter ATP-binding protein [Leptospiraceae bacterium]